MAEDIDILDEGTNALAMITIMRNETLTKKPDHEFVSYFNEIEVAIRKMRTRNLKMLGTIDYLERSMANISDVDSKFEEHIENLPENKEQFSEETSNRNLSLGNRELPKGDRDDETPPF